MKKVNAQQDVGYYVEQRHWCALEAGNNADVDGFDFFSVAFVRHHVAHFGVHNTEGQVEQVPHDERQNDDSRPAHCATCKVCDLVVAGTLVLHGTRFTIQTCERPCSMKVQEQHGDEATTKNPQHPALGGKRIQKCLQEVRVMVQVGRTRIHLQVADHVKEDKAHHGDACDCHDVLLAHRGGIEVD